MVQAGAISQDTAKAYQQGNYRYASSRAAGEVTGTVLMLALPGVAKAGIGKLGQVLKTSTYAKEFATGSFVTKNGIHLDQKALHLHERSVERKVTQETILRTLKEPEGIGKIKTNPETGRRSQMFVTKDTAVVVNPDEKRIITVIKIDEKRANTYIRSFNK